MSYFLKAGFIYTVYFVHMRRQKYVWLSFIFWQNLAVLLNFKEILQTKMLQRMYKMRWRKSCIVYLITKSAQR